MTTCQLTNKSRNISLYQTTFNRDTNAERTERPNERVMRFMSSNRVGVTRPTRGEKINDNFKNPLERTVFWIV